MTAGERRRLARPFAPALLKRAARLARDYRFIIEAEEDGGFTGATVEMPTVMGGGKSVQACYRDTLDATAATIAMMLERGERAPSPSRDAARSQQVNVRLSSDEKLHLELIARREGFRSVSDYVRSAAMRRGA